MSWDVLSRCSLAVRVFDCRVKGSQVQIPTCMLLRTKASAEYIYDIVFLALNVILGIDMGIIKNLIEPEGLFG